MCMDSHDHLFFECSFSNSLWKMLQVDMGASGLPDRWEGMLDAILGITGALGN